MIAQKGRSMCKHGDKPDPVLSSCSAAVCFVYSITHSSARGPLLIFQVSHTHGAGSMHTVMECKGGAGGCLLPHAPCSPSTHHIPCTRTCETVVLTTLTNLTKIVAETIHRNLQVSEQAESTLKVPGHELSRQQSDIREVKDNNKKPSQMIHLYNSAFISIFNYVSGMRSVTWTILNCGIPR